jgi:hypothetical protein
MAHPQAPEQQMQALSPASPADFALAAMFAPGLEPTRRLYRIEAHWIGGGFGFTKAFPNSEAAARWGCERAANRPEAIVTVVERGVELEGV